MQLSGVSSKLFKPASGLFKKISIAGLVSFVCTGAVAQFGEFCGTDQSTVDKEEYYFNSRFEKELVQQRAPYNGIYWVPIQLHLLLRNDGSGLQANNATAWELDTLNARFGRQNIRFFECAPKHKILNSAFYDSSYSSDKNHTCTSQTAEYILAQTYNVPNVINIYLIDSSNTSHAHFPSQRTSMCADWIIINKHQMQWYGVLAHEVGHYLNLFHTFNGEKLAANREHVTRLSTNSCYNCETVGDLICDTQADPDTSRSGSWNASCNFTMATKDTGCFLSSFSPWSENIMSYSTTCSHFFTDGQFTRMKAALNSSLRNYLNCGSLTVCQTSHTLFGNHIASSNYFQAENTISSTANMASSPLIVYDAGNKITLSPGFRAAPTGSRVFKAFIDGCFGDRIYDRNAGRERTVPLQAEIVKTAATIMSEFYTNLPPNRSFTLTVFDRNNRVVSKRNFRNFSKEQAISFYHNPLSTEVQKMQLTDENKQIIFEEILKR